MPPDHRLATFDRVAVNDLEGDLLRAVCAKPHEDEPRLVYADWLEERGARLVVLAGFMELTGALAESIPASINEELEVLAELKDTHPGCALLFEALEHNPHALAIHQAIWATLSALDLPRQLVARYIEVTRQSVFYLDPHVCIRCRYRSTELLWQCPHCHEWNTFVEERLAARRGLRQRQPRPAVSHGNETRLVATSG